MSVTDNPNDSVSEPHVFGDLRSITGCPHELLQLRSRSKLVLIGLEHARFICGSRDYPAM